MGGRFCRWRIGLDSVEFGGEMVMLSLSLTIQPRELDSDIIHNLPGKRKTIRVSRLAYEGLGQPHIPPLPSNIEVGKVHDT